MTGRSTGRIVPGGRTHARASSALPALRPGSRPARQREPNGISGIDPVPESNLLLVPGNDPHSVSNVASLSQSKSDSVDGGLYEILGDKSKSIRERVNLFCKALPVERVTDLDIYTFDVDANCLAMGCGHGMPKETLFAYASVQFKDGLKSLSCPHLKNRDESNDLCKRPWPS